MIEDAFRVACGDIGMSPESFWALTYVELQLILEGYEEKSRRNAKLQRELAAWTASIVIAPHIKEPISPAELLGEAKKSKKPAKSREHELDDALDFAFSHYRRV